MPVVLCASACALVLSLAAWAQAARAARSRIPTQAPADAVIDGPGAPIVSLDGLSIARDGTGGLVYLKDVGGAAHVFVSILSGGDFQAPVQVDTGLPGPSSQPVVAAGNGGVLLVAFINGGTLYVSQTTAIGTPLSAPAALFGGAANPAISMSNFGKAYLAFTDTGGAGGGDVRTAFWYQGSWALESAPLDANPSDAAGLGAGRPAVIAAGDGVGIVAWGEAGHIYTRRVVGTTPSVVYEQADPASLGGWQEVSSADPVISAGGDDTYATVAFAETLTGGGSQQTIVVDNRLLGSQYEGAQEADGTALGGGASAGDPQAAVTEYGRGFVTSALIPGNELFYAAIATNDAFGGVSRVDSIPNSGPPYAVPAVAGLTSTMIAWQQTPGIAGPAEIRLRYAPNGYDLGPEEVVSSPALGPADAAQGLVAGGDVAGDAAVAWVQGGPGQEAIVAAQLFQAPGSFVPAHGFEYSTSATPALAWSPASELWGSPEYEVSVDGTPVGQTTALSLVPPAPLVNGRNTYVVTAVNQAGVGTTARQATVFVDTVPPTAAIRLRGPGAVGLPERIAVSYRDLPPAGLPQSAASGVATVYVDWGDGTVERIRRNDAAHVYRRARRYTVTVTVTDRAGNRTVVRARILVRRHPRRPRARPRRRGHGAGRHAQGRGRRHGGRRPARRHGGLRPARRHGGRRPARAAGHPMRGPA